MQGRPVNADTISNPIDRLLRQKGWLLSDLNYKLKLNMNDLLKSDGLLAIMTIVIGLVSTVQTFWEKLVLIVLAVGIIALRSYLKSKEQWRK
jgi:hypothetical protein